jgi:hypothetical protein
MIVVFSYVLVQITECPFILSNRQQSWMKGKRSKVGCMMEATKQVIPNIRLGELFSEVLEKSLPC